MDNMLLMWRERIFINTGDFSPHITHMLIPRESSIKKIPDN